MLGCIHTLEAPGVSVVYQYQTKSGPLTLSASSYSFDVHHGVIKLWNVKLTDPKGAIIAQADSIRATGLDPKRGADQVIRMDANHFSGRLVREKNGRFAFQDFLPEHKGAPSEIPYEISISDSHLDYVDRTGPSEWIRSIDSPEVHVSGVGQDWVASSQANIQNAGIASLRISNLPNKGLQIEGETSKQGLEVASLVTHFLETPDSSRLKDLRSFRVGTLNIKGPFSLAIPTSGQNPEFKANLETSGTNIAFKQYSLSKGSFSGLVDQKGLKGTLQASQASTQIAFSGSADWSRTFSVGGSLSVKGADSKQLPSWVKNYLPSGVGFQGGQFSGWITYLSPKNYRLVGDVASSQVRYLSDEVDHPSLSVDVDPQRLVAKVKNADYDHQPIWGSIRVDLKTKVISGVASTRNLNIGKVASRFGYRQLSGISDVTASFGGTLSDPKVAFSSHGSGAVTIDKKHTLSLGHFEGVGTYQAGYLHLDRGVFDTSEGLLTATGTLGNSGGLGLKVVVRGVQLGAYSRDLTGTANLTATVSGTIKDPVAIGRMEGFDIGYKDQMIPAIASNFHVNRHEAKLESIDAIRGTTSITGGATVELKSRKVEGALVVHDVQIADLLGDEYIGAVDIPDVQLSGTLDSPKITGNVKGSSLIVRGVKIDSVTAAIEGSLKSVTLKSLVATGADGIISASATYDIETSAGKVVAKAEHLDLDKMVPELSDSIAVEGKISGSAEISFEKSQITKTSLTGDLSNIFVNGSPLGSGPWQVQSDGRTYKGNIEIGDLQRYITLDNAQFDPQTKRISGELTLFNVKAQNIVSASLRYFPNLDFDTREKIQALTADLNMASRFEGTLDQPTIYADSLQAAEIKYHNEVVGEINSIFSLHDHKWDIKSLTLSKGPATVALSGTIDEHGETHIDGSSGNSVDLSKLGEFDPRLGSLTGNVHLWFNIDGPTKTPNVVASLKANDLFALPGNGRGSPNEDKNLRFNLDKIVVQHTTDNQALLKAEGEYFYKGFKGAITGSAPFEYPFKLNSAGPIQTKVTLSESDVQEIAPLLGGIDSKRSSGKVSGFVEASGSPSDVSFKGHLSLISDELAFIGVNDSLRKVEVNANLDSDRLDVESKGSTSRGGNFTGQASTPIGKFSQLLEQYQKGGASSLLERNVSGSLNFDKLMFRQTFLVDSVAAGTVTGNINLAGSLQRPTVSGQIDLSKGDLIFKGVPPSTSVATEFPINPRLDLKLALSDPARLQSSTANMFLLGEGSLQGSLQFPNANASLYVDHGTIRLPAALLRLDQGGTVQVAYKNTRTGSTAVANVDLEGTTSVTTSRTGETDIQRYSIQLGMKGDLLDSNGISLTASSDPPDLSQDRILGILGQTSFLQNLSTGIKQSEAVGAVAQFVVPTLLDPLTAQIAKGVGLDYLNLEYNLFDQASVAFGKDLGAGFSIIGSRQLSEPPPGFTPRFDFRVIYRPRRLPGALRQIRFFFGADQERPWKLGLDYGIRF